MDDLISRQAAIEEWKNDFKGYVNALNIPRDDYNGIMEYIDELPSAQPEIIYCVGCKYMYTEETGFWCAQTGKEVRLDHYCGYAERR